MVYFKPFRITGKENETIYDTGLPSTKENPVRLLSVLVNVSAYQDNDVQGWHEREKIFEFPDKLIDTVEEGSTDKIGKSFNRVNEIEVGFDVPAGSIFKAAIKCGATKSDLLGTYRYEIIS